MSYPQQPMPGVPGESTQPTPGVGQPLPPPQPSLSAVPPPVYSPVQAPPRRPAGIVIGAIGLFAIGMGYLLSAIMAGVAVFHMATIVGGFALPASSAGQFLSLGSTVTAGADGVALLPYVASLLIDLTMMIAAVTGGVLVLMNKPIGRVLAFAVAGGAILMSCATGGRTVAMLLVFSGETAVGLVGLSAFAALFVIAVAVVAMLAPRRVEEWMRQPGRTAPVFAPAMTGALPAQAPMGLAPAAGPVGAPPADQPPPT